MQLLKIKKKKLHLLKSDVKLFPLSEVHVLATITQFLTSGWSIHFQNTCACGPQLVSYDFYSLLDKPDQEVFCKNVINHS